MLDLTGALLTPGLVDLRARFGEPGQEERETITTGLRAAAAGGFAEVCVLPETTPPIDDAAGLEFWRTRAAAHAGVIAELEAAGVRPSGYAGVSGGALVGAAYLGGASMDALVEEASQLHPWFWVRGWGGGLLSGTKLGILIDEGRLDLDAEVPWSSCNIFSTIPFMRLAWF